MSITRDVISDLWPLYAAGECSPDSRALVERFLRDDPEFARRLRAAGDLPAAAPVLPPDGEVRALTRTRELLNGSRWLRSLRLVALALTGLTGARVIESSSWNDTTQRVAATAVMAVIAWVSYLLLLRRQRGRVLRTSAAQSR